MTDKKRTYTKGPPEVRFWQHVNKTDGCWLWTGTLGGVRPGYVGYGTFNLGNGKYVRAHRFAYEQLHGPIPEGKLLCHSCDDTRCVNPAHLFLGDQADNMRDMIRKDRGAGQFKAKDRCPRGHEYSKRKNGQNRCLTCESIRYRERKSEGR